MKASTAAVEADHPSSTADGPAVSKSLVSDLMELTKARLSLLVVFTTLAGFLAGAFPGIDLWILLATLLGTSLSAAGASALNQWWERDLDGRMRRTKDRPLPGGRLHPSDALLIGILFSVVGVVSLAGFVNLLTAGLAALTIGIYLFIYTPMKTLSPVNTLVGAVPGALPPLLGWTAATNEIGIGGLFLFAVLWFWQMPHFLAISWMYREDYKRAGFAMLSGTDEDGMISARQAVVYTFYLLCLSLLPVIYGTVHLWFLPVALLTGGGFFYGAVQFLRFRSHAAARKLFLWSILYLPVFLVLYVAALAGP